MQYDLNCVESAIKYQPTNLLIFKIWNIQNIRFASSLIASCEFYYDDVTVSSFINIKYGDIANESIP